MEDAFRVLLEKEILPRFINKFSKVTIGNEKYIFPDMYIRILNIDEEKYCVLYADYLDDDLKFNIGIFEKAGLKVKEFLPLLTNQEKYSLYFENDVCDNNFLLAKIA